MAGKITYMAPIDNASGKIFGKKNKFISVTRSWGNRQKGCSIQGQRNYITNPLTQDEQAQRSAFKAASALRSLILKNSALRREWQSQFKDDRAAGATSCSTLGGYLMQKAMNGEIAEDGSAA